MEECCFINYDIQGYIYPLKQLIERVEETIFEMKTQMLQRNVFISKIRLIFRLSLALQELILNPHIKALKEIKRFVDYLEIQFESNASNEIKYLILIMLSILLDKNSVSDLLINCKGKVSESEYLSTISNEIVRKENHNNMQPIISDYCNFIRRSIEDKSEFSSMDLTEIHSKISD